MLLKLIDMTIHWKALEEHFLMVPFNFGGMAQWYKNLYT
jgi:hypothetical protein